MYSVVCECYLLNLKKNNIKIGRHLIVSLVSNSCSSIALFKSFLGYLIQQIHLCRNISFFVNALVHCQYSFDWGSDKNITNDDFNQLGKHLSLSDVRKSSV